MLHKTTEIESFFYIIFKEITFKLKNIFFFIKPPLTQVKVEGTNWVLVQTADVEPDAV